MGLAPLYKNCPQIVTVPTDWSTQVHKGVYIVYMHSFMMFYVCISCFTQMSKDSPAFAWVLVSLRQRSNLPFLFHQDTERIREMGTQFPKVNSLGTATQVVQQASGLRAMNRWEWFTYNIPGIPTTIKTMGVNITTIAYLRVSIIEIGSTIFFVVVEAQGYVMFNNHQRTTTLR